MSVEKNVLNIQGEKANINFKLTASALPKTYNFRLINFETERARWLKT